ncbi:nuclear transport factor 2 family protein [Pseudonocardia sp. CA-142604]|uniref:nuclear transport factor 2 family protein n=1 Tax=Pseudonocardia sp. CA-142604 TaxID=3240024 RepID=UPI003D8F9A88
MPTDIPAPVADYLTAKVGDPVEAVLRNFADDAVVHDEGTNHVGASAIRDWAAEISARYQLERTVVETHRIGAAAVVLVRVAGNFPGSPVDLHHHFTVSDDRITALTICP